MDDKIINIGGHMPQQGRKMKLTERRYLEWELYKSGESYRQIQATLLREHDIKISHVTVSVDIQRIADDLNAKSLKLAARHRTVQLERLRVATLAIWDDVLNGVVEAIHVMIRLMEREAKLLGLDAPARIDIEQRVRTMAVEQGLDADEAVRQAEIITREAGIK